MQESVLRRVSKMTEFYLVFKNNFKFDMHIQNINQEASCDKHFNNKIIHIIKVLTSVLKSNIEEVLQLRICSVQLS